MCVPGIALHTYSIEVSPRTVVEQIFGRATRFAEVATRIKPVAEDVLVACEEYDLDVKELRKESRKRRRNRKNSQLSGAQLASRYALIMSRSRSRLSP